MRQGYVFGRNLRENARSRIVEKDVSSRDVARQMVFPQRVDQHPPLSMNDRLGLSYASIWKRKSDMQIGSSETKVSNKDY